MCCARDRWGCVRSVGHALPLSTSPEGLGRDYDGDYNADGGDHHGSHPREGTNLRPVDTGFRPDWIVEDPLPATVRDAASSMEQIIRRRVDVAERAPVDVAVDAERGGAWLLVAPFHRPQHFLYFLPDSQGQGSLRPIFCTRLCIVFVS